MKLDFVGDHNKEFYKSSVTIDKFTNKVFREMAAQHGYLSVLKDLTRANKQDIKKRLFSTYVKLFNIKL